MDQLIRTYCDLLVDHVDRIDWQALTAADWQSFAAQAQRHGIAPLICHKLQKHGWPHHMPVAARQSLLQAHYAATAENMLLHAELRRIVAALCTKHALVLLKGAALGATLYERPALRPMSDLDLLVQRSALPDILQILEDLGYVVTPEIAPGIHQAIEHHEHLQGGPQQRVGLDLHWNLIAGDADWRTPPVAWFWQQTQPLIPKPEYDPSALCSRSDGDAPIRELTPTAHLLYLAAHVMLQHCGEQARLIWFYDLHLLITHAGDRIDWQELVQRAAEFRWSAALLGALEGTIACFGTVVPEFVVAMLRADHDPDAANFVQRKTRATFMASEWLNIMTLQRSARWRVLRRTVAPSPRYIRWRYAGGRWFWPLAYARHWLRLAGAAALVVGNTGRAAGRRVLETFHIPHSH